jgi:restriction system protein
MTQHAYAFDRPRWRPPQQLNLSIIGLLLAGLLWIGFYLWLGRRLWQGGLALGNPLNMALILLSIGLGVGVILGWMRVWPQLSARWNARPAESGWPALSLEAMQALTPSEFEAYVAERVFARQGYAVINTPDVKDGGIDILVRDHWGRLAVVQCKRYNSTVGVSTVRDLFGTMIDAGATRAYLAASGRISDAAHKWTADKPIELLDGQQLVQLAKAEPVPRMYTPEETP